MASQHSIALHCKWLNTLFAHTFTVRQVFSDVLELFEIHHIAITYVGRDLRIRALSSTPSLEYNLLSSHLWRSDNTYNPEWFTRCVDAPWPSLYHTHHYDELYYLKQTKPRYPTSVSLAQRFHEGYIIYSFASMSHTAQTKVVFNTKQHEFYQLGSYCADRLATLLLDE